MSPGSNQTLKAASCGGEHKETPVPAAECLECRRCRGGLFCLFADSFPTFEYPPRLDKSGAGKKLSPLCFANDQLIKRDHTELNYNPLSQVS